MESRRRRGRRDFDRYEFDDYGSDGTTGSHIKKPEFYNHGSDGPTGNHEEKKARCAGARGAGYQPWRLDA